MSQKKAILRSLFFFLLAIGCGFANARQVTGQESTPVQMQHWKPLAIPWGAMSRDSASVDFTAYLTLPETLAGTPIAFWLDTAQLHAGKQVIKPLNHLSKAETEFLEALHSLLRMDWLDAGLRHRDGLAHRAESRFQTAYAANFGLLLLAIGESEEGEKRLRLVAERGEAGNAARRSLVNYFLAQGDWDAAENVMEKAISMHWDDAFLLKAKAFVLRQDLSDAAYETFLAQQVAGSKGNVGLRKTYGALLLKQGRYREAAQMFQKAVEWNPKDGDSWVALGRAFKEQDLWIFAEESFRHALQVGTHDLGVYELYARVLWQFFVGKDRDNGDAALAEAQDLLERGLALQLDKAPSAWLLYDVYGWLGKRDAANALREHFWFHFEGPEIPSAPRLCWKDAGAISQPRLHLHVTSTTFPIFHYLQTHRTWPRSRGAVILP